MPRTARLTADELLHLNLPNKRTELVRGLLVVREPPGFIHGYVAQRIATAIANYVNPRELGYVLAAETGFKLFSNPDTVRAPDAAFVRKGRVSDPMPLGYPSMAPDLVVEVLSPNDRPGEVRENVADWLGAGAQLVWIIDPVRRRARVHRADGSDAALDADGSLDGEAVLPGFVLALVDCW